MFLWRRPLILLCPNNESNFRVDTIKVAFVIIHAHQSTFLYIIPLTYKSHLRSEWDSKRVLLSPASISLWKLQRAPSRTAEIFWWQIKPQMMVAVTRHSLTHERCQHLLTLVSSHHRFNRTPAHEIWTIVSRLSRLAFWCRNYNLTIIASAFSFLMSRFHSWHRQRASNPVAWPEKSNVHSSKKKTVLTKY